MVEYQITKLTFSSGQEIELAKRSLIILVGANSVGKSTILRELSAILWNKQSYNHLILKALKRVEYFQTPDKQLWFNWLRDNFQGIINRGVIQFLTIDGSISEDELNLSFPESGIPNHNHLGHFIVRWLDTESRLHLTKPAKRINILEDRISHEFHAVQLDTDKLKIVNIEIQNAFNKDLILDHGAGSTLPAYTGKEPERTSEDDRISPKYLRELRRQTPLDMDGDGIRSFVACLLATKCNPHKIFLIDEPEVFLHPPQARRLGRSLAKNAFEENRQIIVATHSSDFIKGALSYSLGNVQICRIERSADDTVVYSLSNAELRDLWKKPLLRSTDAIQGAFHRGVTICEADADCRFYEAILMRIQHSDLVEPADLHFVHGGGKGELATLALSYMRLHVPTAVITDFDILRNKEELRKLVEALGGEFKQVESLYKTVISTLNKLAPSKDKSSVSAVLRDLAFKLENTNEISSETMDEVSEILQDARLWSEPKKHGIDSLKGGAYQDCENLLLELSSFGLFIVPKGEMEGWDRSLPAKKNEWINAALEKIDLDPNSFEATHRFMHQITAYLGIANQ